MTLKSKTIDWGGNTLIVSNIQYASRPGQLDKPTNAQTSGLAQVTEDAATITLTALQNGSTIIFDKTDGVVVNLPAPQIGMRFNFVVDTVVSSGSHKVLTDSASTFIKGALTYVTTAPAINTDVANGSSHRSIVLNGTTTGGIAGTWFTLICRSATVWEVRSGLVIKSGSVATVFATS